MRPAYLLGVALLPASGLIAPTAPAQGPIPPGRVGPPLETVKVFENFLLVGLAVSHEGRVFASAPSAKTGDKLVEVDTKTGALKPWPSKSWNTPGRDQAQTWNVPQAMWVDGEDRLWVLDSGRRTVTNDQPQGARPKLVEFDLSADKEIRRYTFEGVIAPTDSLNDVRIDLVHGYAYLTNVGNKGSLAVVNLKTGKARQVLVGDRSTYADPKAHLMLGEEPALGADGKPVAIHADGLALSPDSQWLYYRPLTDHNYWRAPTTALIDAHLTPAELSAKVQFLGTAEMSGGLIMDSRSVLYGGDLEHGSVVGLTFDPETHVAHSKILVRDPGKLSWADGFAIHDGYLYISDSHLWEIAFKNHLPVSGAQTIFRVKLPQ